MVWLRDFGSSDSTIKVFFFPRKKVHGMFSNWQLCRCFHLWNFCLPLLGIRGITQTFVYTLMMLLAVTLILDPLTCYTANSGLGNPGRLLTLLTVRRQHCPDSSSLLVAIFDMQSMVVMNVCEFYRPLLLSSSLAGSLSERDREHSQRPQDYRHSQPQRIPHTKL